MVCTTYATMCGRCKSYYTKLRERGRPGAGLEYEAGTYPMVFKCKTLVKIVTEAPSVDRVEVASYEVKKKLKKYYKKEKKKKKTKDFGVFIGGYSELKGNLLTLYTEVLIDFPSKIDKSGDPRTWALSYFPVEVKYKQPEHPQPENTTGNTRPNLKTSQTVHILWTDWETVHPRNEHHLCKKRLEFFMKMDSQCHL